MARPTALFATLALLVLALAGCVGGDSTLRLAFVQPDDSLEPAKRPERLAQAIENATGRPTRIYYVHEVELALQAVGSGQADAAFVDAAAGWYAWRRLSLEVAAAHLESDGRPNYIASAWVLNGSAYRSMEDLRGADSCHTGLLKSAGTFMPLGWMVRNGLVSRVGPDDVSSIEPTLDAFFGTPRVPRSDSDPYGNYQGAMRCLSEGLGQVAMVKDSTPSTFCGPGVTRRPSWCLGVSEYRELQQFGSVPSHPIMVGQESTQKKLDLVAGLTKLSATTEGQGLLMSVLGTRGVVPVASTEAYLGDYAKNMAEVPGMTAYIDSQVRR